MGCGVSDSGNAKCGCGNKVGGGIPLHRGDTPMRPIAEVGYGLCQPAALGLGNIVKAGNGSPPRLLGIAKPIQIGVQIGGGAGAIGAGEFQPAYLNGHLAGGIIFLDPQAQPVGVIKLPFGFAGAIGRGAIGIAGIGQAGLADAITLPGGVAFSTVGKGCDCGPKCGFRDDCCPKVDLEGIQQELTGPGWPEKEQDTCTLTVDAKFAWDVCLPQCWDPACKVRLGWLQMCNYKIIKVYASKTSCDLNQIFCRTKSTEGEWHIDADPGKVLYQDPLELDSEGMCLSDVLTDLPGVTIESKDEPPRPDIVMLRIRGKTWLVTFAVAQCYNCTGPESKYMWYALHFWLWHITWDAGVSLDVVKRQCAELRNGQRKELKFECPQHWVIGPDSDKMIDQQGPLDCKLLDVQKEAGKDRCTEIRAVTINCPNGVYQGGDPINLPPGPIILPGVP